MEGRWEVAGKANRPRRADRRGQLQNNKPMRAGGRGTGSKLIMESRREGHGQHKGPQRVRRREGAAS